VIRTPLPPPGPASDAKGSFQRMLVVRCWRPDRTMPVARQYICSVLGPEFTDPPALDLAGTYHESGVQTPIVCLLSAGSDPSLSIELLNRRLRIVGLHTVSMGQGQEVHARAFVREAMTTGAWVLLQNCHLSIGFLAEMTGMIKAADPEKMAPTFRVWITSEPTPRFPITLLQMSLKLTNEPPRGLRAGLTRCFGWINEELVDVTDRREWHPLLYTLCFMHTALLERRKYGALGWNIPYEFNQSDLMASLQFLSNHLYHASDKGELSWSTIRYMVGEVLYGGRVTDDYDRRLMETYCAHWLDTRTFEAGFEFYKGYTVPSFRNLAELRASVERVPFTDTPEIYGLHANAEVAYRTGETRQILDTLLQTQPKQTAGGSGETREEAVARIARDLLFRVPPSYSRAEVRRHIARLGGLKDAYNVFLAQEVDRMDAVISMVRADLDNLRLAIAGTVVLSARLVEIMNALFDGRVPLEWGSVSWPADNLGLWFADLVQRADQYSSWLFSSRPSVFWLTGFFNAQGFITAMKQSTARAHNGSYSIDTLELRCDVLKHDNPSSLPPLSAEDGVYVHGLFLEGAGWDVKAAKLVDAAPKVLFTKMPIMQLAATSTSLGSGRDRYQCPLYRTPRRTDLNYIFTVGLRTDAPPAVWTRAGVALLASRT
jgi:dynein heavy chain